MKKQLPFVLSAFALLSAASGARADAWPAEQRFRSLYKELVEINTTQSAGSCTLAAERMAAQLKAANIPEDDLHPFVLPEYPRDGGLVVIYPGRDLKTKAVLLLAHLDVVEANREDWQRDPFTLV